MSTTTPLQPVEDTRVPQDVATAYVRYQAAQQQPFGPVLLAAQSVLEAAADTADVALCQWGCLTPYDVTKRSSCCGDNVCSVHEDDHDLLCREFVAQLREAAGR